jgi:precorrin-8X/cobalt-precorrin-8 methylmutase
MGRMQAALFDVYVVVDWSANASPKLGADSIWSHVRTAGEYAGPAERTGSAEPPINHPTRALAREYLTELLTTLADRRVLIGFDLPYGYPSGFAAACGLSGDVPWRATWRHLADRLVDLPDNANNRFEIASALNATISDGPGPFWGTTSPKLVTPNLSRTKAPGFPHGSLAEHRLSELELQRHGLRPFSVWQLAGAGSVGSQTLTGIPVLHALRTHPLLAERSQVWPFETGFTDDPCRGRADAIVHAEIWPSALGRPDPALHPVKDAGQVLALTAHLAALDAAGELAPRFAPRLDPETERVSLAEEGWVLGVGA